jgi:ubiquinone/menaquinone biosynthesis C-methylase UbiE
MSAIRSRAASHSPAEVYDELFVPALFGQWAETVCDLAEIEPGQEVLDVACGTGACALAVAARLQGRGLACGLDPNPDMLAVARAKGSWVEWREGRAEDLPFAAASFDRVVSQFGLMFFDDRPKALREMTRVLRPRGRLVVVVCDGIDHSPGYAVLTELLHRLFGSEVADAFRAPFALGDRDRVRAIARQAGVDAAEIVRRDGTVRFASIDALVSAERACAWTLGGLLEDDEFERLRTAAEESLRPFTADDGSLVFGMPALCLVAAKPEDHGRHRLQREQHLGRTSTGRESG